jgi:NADH dehydrogenase
VNAVNIVENEIEASIGVFPLDYLFIAPGSETNYFNFEEVKDILLTLKSIQDALNLRIFVFQNLEKALINQNIQSLEEILNIAIVAGGQAGIELAGGTRRNETLHNS